MKRKFNPEAFHPLLRGEEKLTMSHINALDDESYDDVLRIVIDHEKNRSFILHEFKKLAHEKNIKADDYFSCPELVKECHEFLSDNAKNHLAASRWEEYSSVQKLISVFDQMAAEKLG